MDGRGWDGRDLKPEERYSWDVPERMELDRRVRSGRYDVVPGVRALRRSFRLLSLLLVLAIVVVVVAVALTS